ncbi:MAG: hypothetical protein JSW23_04195 [Planctomycetota bacterium]|nr:MAG: hypothetical protein JSW23_04195 [Planctomycetota bacterium]
MRCRDMKVSMATIRMVIFSLTLLAGLCLVMYSPRGASEVWDVWSEFKAFSARVAGDEGARHALKYGGERDDTDFDYLLARVRMLSDRWDTALLIGFFVCFVSVAGIILELVSRRRETIKEVRIKK